MAASIVSSDIIDGATLSDDINGQVSVVRSFIVKDVAGTAPERLVNAINVPGIDIGDTHPNISPTLFVTKRTAKPINESSTQFRVDITYSTIPGDQGGSQNVNTGSTVSFGTSLSSIQTTKNAAGTEMVVGSVDPDDNGNAVADYSGGTPVVPKQPVIVEKLVPTTVIRASRKETTIPTSTAQTIVGKLNSASVTIGGVSFAAKTLMCTSITADTNDNENSYIVSYEFQYRVADDWKITAVAIKPDTGAPWPKIDSVTNGKVTEDIYETTSFAGLNL